MNRGVVGFDSWETCLSTMALLFPLFLGDEIEFEGG